MGEPYAQFEILESGFEGKVYCVITSDSCILGRCVYVLYIIINHFYIALFSALEQTHCAHM